MDKTDCFAYNAERPTKSNGCTALKIKDCENCKFYKPVENATAERDKIRKQCNKYQAMH